MIIYLKKVKEGAGDENRGWKSIKQVSFISFIFQANLRISFSIVSPNITQPCSFHRLQAIRSLTNLAIKLVNAATFIGTVAGLPPLILSPSLSLCLCPCPCTR